MYFFETLYTLSLGRKPHFQQYQYFKPVLATEGSPHRVPGCPSKEQVISYHCPIKSSSKNPNFYNSRHNFGLHQMWLKCIFLKTRSVSSLLTPEAPIAVPGPSEAHNGHQTEPNQPALPLDRVGSGGTRNTPPPRFRCKWRHMGAFIHSPTLTHLPTLHWSRNGARHSPTHSMNSPLRSWTARERKETLRLQQRAHARTHVTSGAGNTGAESLPSCSANTPGLPDPGRVHVFPSPGGLGRDPGQSFWRCTGPWTPASAPCLPLLRCLFL